MKTNPVVMFLALVFLWGSACSNLEMIPPQEAADAVLHQMDVKRRPADLTVKLEPPAHRFGDVEQVWEVESETGGYAGWVDAETGEVLDIIIEATGDEFL